MGKPPLSALHFCALVALFQCPWPWLDNLSGPSPYTYAMALLFSPRTQMNYSNLDNPQCSPFHTFPLPLLPFCPPVLTAGSMTKQTMHLNTNTLGMTKHGQHTDKRSHAGTATASNPKWVHSIPYVDGIQHRFKARLGPQHFGIFSVFAQSSAGSPALQ